MIVPLLLFLSGILVGVLIGGFHQRNKVRLYETLLHERFQIPFEFLAAAKLSERLLEKQEHR